MFDTEIANEKYSRILDGIGNLAAECFTKGIKKRPEMKSIQERLQLLRRALHREQAEGQKSSILDIFGNNAHRKHFERNGGLILQGTSGLCIFTEQSLKTITRKYSTVVGRRTSNSVYMGWVDDNTRVAVKMPVTPWITSEVKTDYIINAVQSACRISNGNIIRLVGCCLETDDPFVYEFADNGSLYDVLHGNDGKRCLPLHSRLNIAIGSAEALAYGHSVRPTQIVHGNITSYNILLDHNFLPKVFFKITKPRDRRYVLCDTWYAEPVYLKTGVFTPKSDVYSFGIVLLEIITRKTARYEDGDGVTHSLPFDYIEVLNEQNSGKSMVDKEIAVEGNIVILEEMGKLAVECVNEDADVRPEMVEAVERLQKIRSDWERSEGSCSLQELSCRGGGSKSHRNRNIIMSLMGAEL